MKKFLGSFLIGLLAANVAFAIVDPDTNSMGIYFDGNADVYEYETNPLIEVMVYIILTNPDFGKKYGNDSLICLCRLGTVLDACGSTIFHPPMITACWRVADTSVMHSSP